jgi:hypothetical protein
VERLRARIAKVPTQDRGLSMKVPVGRDWVRKALQGPKEDARYDKSNYIINLRRRTTAKVHHTLFTTRRSHSISIRSYHIRQETTKFYDIKSTTETTRYSRPTYHILSLQETSLRMRQKHAGTKEARFHCPFPCVRFNPNRRMPYTATYPNSKCEKPSKRGRVNRL